MSYMIVRHYASGRIRKRVLETGLTLEEARRHCNDSETSSRTATSARAREITRRCGAWFDGYEEER